MDSLPVELVAAVFRQLGLKDCISVSHVCQRWRAAAIGDPLLWTQLAVESAPIEAVETLVARSRDASLSLGTATLIQGEEDRLARILSENMGRMNFLRFQTTLPCFTETVRDALCTPAPRMEFFDMRSPDEDLSLPPLLFGGFAPCLHSLKLHAVGLPSSCPALAKVFSLSLALPNTPPSEPFCLSDVLPGLLRLELTNQSDVPHVSLKLGHHLFSLDIVSKMGLSVDLCAPLRAVNHADSFFVTATTTNIDTLTFVFDGIGWQGVSTISLGLSKPAHDARGDTARPTVYVSFGSPFTPRRFPIVEESAAAALLDDTSRMASITSLNIAHHLLHLAPGLLSNVMDLYIEFPREDVGLDYGHLALWLGDSQRAPRLETLTLCGEWQADRELGYCPLTRPRVLSAAQLAACLQTRASPLLELRLRVQMEETPETVHLLLSPIVQTLYRFQSLDIRGCVTECHRT